MEEIIDFKRKEQSEESSEENDAFMEGFESEEVNECAECGSAVNEENRVERNINGENYVFCSEQCADEFEDSLAE